MKRVENEEEGLAPRVGKLEGRVSILESSERKKLREMDKHFTASLQEFLYIICAFVIIFHIGIFIYIHYGF